MMFSALSTILVAVLSFSANLYRAFLSFTETSTFDEVLISSALVLGHVIIIFIDNYTGQTLMDNSVAIFTETYNSLWYRVPLKYQKLLLLILLRGSSEVQFNLGGLFVPCYEGFATMMSSSFSYFTVLYSV
ncbi:odorant receptor 10-like [Augochlora pura]